MGNKNLWKPLKLKPSVSRANHSATPASGSAGPTIQEHQRVPTSRDVRRAFNARQTAGSTPSGVYVFSGGRYSQSEPVLLPHDHASISPSQEVTPVGTPSPRASSPAYDSPSMNPGFSSDYPESSQTDSRLAHYRSSRVNQWTKWSQVVIPSLIQPYLALTRRTENLGAVDRKYLVECTCGRASSRTLTVTCIHFDCKDTFTCNKQIMILTYLAIEEITIRTCICTPAPQALLARGLMPSSPTNPTLAVDVKLLEFARMQFLHMAPNTTGWCAALEACLRNLGFKLQTVVSYSIHSGIHLLMNCIRIHSDVGSPHVYAGTMPSSMLRRHDCRIFYSRRGNRCHQLANHR